MNGANRLEQIRIHRPFENISGSPGGKNRPQVSDIVVHGEDQNPGGGRLPKEPLQGLHSSDARHGQIEQSDVRLGLTRDIDCLFAIGSLPNNFHVGLRIQKNLQAGAKDGMVVGEENSNLTLYRGHVRNGSLSNCPVPVEVNEAVPPSRALLSRMLRRPK